MLPPNGLELSCPAARARAHPFSHIPAGKSRSNFPHASRVSCSELLGSAEAASHFRTTGLSRMITRSLATRSISCLSGWPPPVRCTWKYSAYLELRSK